LVSIVVNNHNYAEFLGDAIRSALEQRDVDREVIVVDDGSTDGSREVIESFGTEVKPMFQANLGQKGAFNAGFSAARGDVVMFLDADDELSPGIVSKVADAFAAHPSSGRVVYRLEIVDRDGQPTGALLPARRMPLASGDLRREVMSSPDDLPWPPTSGNAFARWVLAHVMPLPVDDDPTGADALLHALTPLLAPAVALDTIGGSYRLHERNAHFRPGFDVARSRRLLRRADASHAAIRQLASELGYGDAKPCSVTLAAHRLVSQRIGGADHPVDHDTRLRAAIHGLRAAAARADVGRGRRAAYAAWFLLGIILPRRLLLAVAARSFQPARARPMRRTGQ
jgi:glycosyltransferase involved in cell wall biosynthesis